MARPRITADASTPEFQRSTGEDVYVRIDKDGLVVSIHLWSTEVDDLIAKLIAANAKAREQWMARGTA